MSDRRPQSSPRRRGRPGYDLAGLLDVAVEVFNERGYDGRAWTTWRAAGHLQVGDLSPRRGQGGAAPARPRPRPRWVVRRRRRRHIRARAAVAQLEQLVRGASACSASACPSSPCSSASTATRASNGPPSPVAASSTTRRRPRRPGHRRRRRASGRRPGDHQPVAVRVGQLAQRVVSPRGHRPHADLRCGRAHRLRGHPQPAPVGAGVEHNVAHWFPFW